MTAVTIHLDMDGVFVDMDRFIREELGEDATKDDALMWKRLQTIPSVYRKMPPTPYARELWLAVKATGLPNCMLTALPRISSVPEAQNDKNWWVDHYRNEVFCGDRPKVNVGPFSRDKWRHCKFGDILIDDRADNCKSWTGVGGFAIHHAGNDVQSTIERLKWLTENIAR